MKKKSNVVAHCATDNLKKGLKSSEYKEGRFWDYPYSWLNVLI